MKKRRMLFAFLAIVCILSVFPLFALGASAEGERVVYATTRSSTVQQGSYTYLDVYLDDLTDLSALNVSIYYDPEQVTVKSTYNSVSATVQDINATSGCINASYIFDGKGGATKTKLFYCYFQVNSTAEVGDVYFDIVVTEAYDNSLNDIAFRGSRCAFKVTEENVSKSCSISSTSTVSTSVGEEFELSYRLSTYSVASGSMAIQYDPELFEVVSVTNGEFLTNKISDVNTALDGAVYLSFIGTSYQYKYDLVTVRFKTLKNVSESSDIKLVVSELHDIDLNPYSCNGYTTKANIVFDDTYTENAPSMSVSAAYDPITEKVTATITLDKDSMLGAGDFMLNFNTDMLTYASAEMGFEPTFYIINDTKAAEGELLFYIISTEDIKKQQTVLIVTFDVKHTCVDSLVDFEISGSGLTDSLTNTIILNFVGSSLVIQSPGHDKVYHDSKSPNCTEYGWDAYETCTRCDYTTYNELTALGHDEVHHDAKSPTCTESGWLEYEKCSRCDYTTYVEIPALGHRVLVDGRIWVDSINYENDSTYPFVLENGIYSSSNKANSSDSYFTITALYDCTLNISYAVSSEQNYDKLIIRRNGSTIVEISGLVDWDSKTVNLSAGDVVTVNYHKDVSAASNQDTGWFTFSCEQTQIGTLVPAPAEDAEATCTEAVVCHYCQTIVKDALGHDISDWAETQAPTCTENGIERGDCSRCDYYETREVNATGHTYDSVITLPTCTDRGYTTYTCHCGDNYVDSYVGALDHNFASWTEIKSPTCTEKGAERRDCTRCDYYETRDVNATGHSYDAVITSPTCTDRGYTTHTCHCGDSYVDSYVSAFDHNFGSWTETKAPTCTENGAERRDCSRCDYYETRTINATGHTYSSVITTPTCTERGFTTHTCHCGDSYVDTYTVALGHNLGDWTETNAPTCTENGAERRDCSRCDYYESRTVVANGHISTDWIIDSEATYESDGIKHKECVICFAVLEESFIPMLTHSYESTVVLPTCTEQGYTIHTCSDCGETYVDDYVDALGHAFDAWIQTKAPTCTEKGTDRRDCSACEYYETRDVGIIAHSYSEVVTYPTCTDRGYTTYTCNCGDSYVDSYVNALDHNLSAWIETKAPTCTEKGAERRDCTRCDYYETREVNATGHSYDAVITSPTCTNRGYTTHTCHCGDSYVDSYVSALDHNFGSWTETKAPTCTETGTERRDCSRCDYYETKSISATGHSYSIVSTDPTCTERGYTTHTCSKCGNAYVDNYISAIGHNFGTWYETKAPTCTEEGIDERECSACYTKETRTIVAYGHKTSTPVVENSVEPNCITDGSYDSVVYCSVCADELSRTNMLVDKLGHVYIIDTGITPTCTEVGLTEGSHCGRCSEILVAQEVIPSIGHKYGEWIEITAPGKDTKGSESRYCEKCDYCETREIAPLGYVNDFIDAVNSLTEDQSLEDAFSELYTALVLYSKLSEDEKQSVSDSFAILQLAIEDYNDEAKLVNKELANATEVAFAPITANFAFLAALWFILKKKFKV